MRKAALTIIGGAILVVACAESGTLGDQLTGPLFSHVVEDCKRGDQLITSWPVGTAPDSNNNGKVCATTSNSHHKGVTEYYDDITHTSGGGTGHKGGGGPKK